jgi:mRNA interferase RelE/StbE
MTAFFNIRFKPSVKKDLRSIPQKEIVRILEIINGLQTNPRPNNAQPLTGRDAWRVRVGCYRVIYTIDDDSVIIEVVKVGHRKDVYR